MPAIELQPFITAWLHSWVIKSLQQSWVGLQVRAIISWSRVASWSFTSLNFKPWYLKYSSQNTSAHQPKTNHKPLHQSIQRRRRCCKTKESFFPGHTAQSLRLFGKLQLRRHVAKTSGALFGIALMLMGGSANNPLWPYSCKAKRQSKCYWLKL